MIKRNRLQTFVLLFLTVDAAISGAYLISRGPWPLGLAFLAAAAGLGFFAIRSAREPLEEAP